MAFAKSLSLAAMLTVIGAEVAHADPLKMKWTTWQPGVGVVEATPSGTPLSPASLFWPAATPSQPAAPLTAQRASVAAPFMQAVPAPAPITVQPIQPAPPVQVAAPAFQAAPVQVPAFQAPAFQAPAAPAPMADAFVNLGTGPYANAGSLTTGNAQPWYNSSGVANLFGGSISSAQQAQFDSTVIQRVEQTFALSGIPITLTTDPNAPAAHSLSVVANTVSNILPTAIGMTNLGGNGFSFIDQSAKAASSVDQLEWIVAHNVSHELMLAFGVSENYDTTGNFIDARNATFAMMVNPNATFSQAASQALKSTDFTATVNTPFATGAQLIPEAVPEPATLALWLTAPVALLIWHRRRTAQAA
jgi:hypothetical protein